MLLPYPPRVLLLLSTVQSRTDNGLCEDILPVKYTLGRTHTPCLVEVGVGRGLSHPSRNNLMYLIHCCQTTPPLNLAQLLSLTAKQGFFCNLQRHHNLRKR